MDVCSVIIPTVQKKLSVLLELLKTLGTDKFVDEVLVVNNKPEKPLDLTEYKKVRVIEPEENLYVNPSWNLGIEECKNNNFLLLNDDVLICSDLIESVITSPVFNNPSTGLIGAANQSIVQFDKKTETLTNPVSDEKVEFLGLFNYMHTGDWGISIFGKKENYYNIPDDLKIIYGDNYILYKNLQNNKINYSVSGKTYHHIHSSSSASAEFSNIVGSDCENYKKYFEDKSKKEKPEKEESEPQEQKNSTEQFKGYSISFKDNICFVNVKNNNSKHTICIKHKDNNGTISKSELYSTLIKFSITPDMSQLIADDIIAQSKIC